MDYKIHKWLKVNNMSNSEIVITEKDVMEVIGLFTKVPAILLRGWVSKNSNLVKLFEGQIESHKNRLSDHDLARARMVVDMPVEEIQEILRKTYDKTGKKQLKILSDPKARPFIITNLKEARKVLFE